MTRVMIIDDDEGTRRLLKEVLELNGYVTAEASNGKEAMEEMKRNPSDIIIVDIIMPVMDGLETIIRMRSEYPFVKFIAISGGGQIEPSCYLENAERLGAFRSFSKPIDYTKLLEAVEELAADLHH